MSQNYSYDNKAIPKGQDKDNEKITDEGLKLKRLLNTSILFYIQTILILGFIIFTTIKYGFYSLSTNPFVFIFLVTSIIHEFLEMGITKEISTKNSIKSIIARLALVLVAGIIVYFCFPKAMNAGLYFAVLLFSLCLVLGIAALIIKKK